MKRKNYFLPAALAVFSVAVICLGALYLRQMALRRVNEERRQQLEELTEQLSDTFGNALAFNLAGVETAVNLFADGEYASAEDISAAAGKIGQTIFPKENAEEGERLFFLDENGACYDEDGTRGIWGDFDRVIGDGDSFVFIADSPTYEGVHWAFARRLEPAVSTLDGRVTIRYAVLLKPVKMMRGYYASDAYEDICETYILQENGTRMYDSVTSEDTIPSYNVYKALREAKNSYGESFDDVLENLADKGVASGNYESGGTEYCYSLAWQSDYQVVLLFLIPASAVAVNTVAMVSAMMVIFLIFALIVITLVSLFLFLLLRVAASRQVADLKEQNLQETKAANEQLMAMNESLIKANRAAKSALDIARSANRAKSNFLSNMSHDIRTPLNAIIGFLTLLERDAENPAQVRLYTEKIRVSSRHLLNLINDILDMSRIESGKTTLNMQEFSVGSLLSETQNVIEPQAHAKNLNFIMDTADTAALVIRGDRLRLGQILMNLLSNAVKYTQEGGTIRFGVEKTGKQTAQMVTLKFSVKDNGVGMSPEFQKRVFEPFERERGEAVGSTQGTGLGMAITKNLVDLMGGIIIVDSVPGKGSVFTVELSFPLAAAEESQMTLPEPAAKEENEDVLRGLHFLVAEDNEINAEIIRELLAMEGATCEIAENGQKAVELFERSQPGTYDAVFMDIQMPVMGGYEAVRRIRACGHADAVRIPIAAMTANAFAEDVQKALEAGMNAHIPKPVDMKKIREFIAGEKEEHKE